MKLTALILFILILFLFFELFNEKPIPIDEINSIPGIINIFWGNTANKENKKPFPPNSFIKNPTVKPNVKPLIIIIKPMIGTPIVKIPIIQTNTIVFKLFKTDCLSNSVEFISSLFKIFKKELKKLMICCFCSPFKIFIEIEPIIIPMMNRIIIVKKVT